MVTEIQASLFNGVITVTGVSSSTIVQSEPVVRNMESTSAAWRQFLGLWKILKSNFTNWSVQPTRFHFISAGVRTLRNEWLPARSVGHARSDYGRNNRLAQTTARWSRLAASRFHFCSVRVCDEYPIGLGVLQSPWTCRRTHPTCLSHAFVNNVEYPFPFGRESSGGDISILPGLLKLLARPLRWVLGLSLAFY